MFVLYTIVDNCNHCSPVNTSSIADGIFNSLNKVFIISIPYFKHLTFTAYSRLQKRLRTSINPKMFYLNET